MAMLLLPWIQQSLRIRNDSSRYRYFYQSVWHNVLILLVIFLANGLTWLVLLLWSELFKLVGITFFKTLFCNRLVYLSHVRSGYRAGGDPRANTVTFNRLYSKLFTLIATGLLPLVSLLTLMFIITLPFTGLSAISRHISAAGLLLTLAFCN